MEKRTLVTRENVTSKEPYDSIIMFFLYASSRDEWSRRGVRFEQLRWAFVKGEDPERLVKEFDEDVLLFVPMAGSIRTKVDLNNTYLKKLLELGIIRRVTERFKKPRYFLCDDFVPVEARNQARDSLDRYEPKEVRCSFDDWGVPRVVLFGVSDELGLSKSEEKRIDARLAEIEEAVLDIERIRDKRLKKMLGDDYLTSPSFRRGVCVCRTRPPLWESMPLPPRLMHKKT